MFKMNNVMLRLSSYSRNCYHRLKLKQNWIKVYIPQMNHVDSLNERLLQPTCDGTTLVRIRHTKRLGFFIQSLVTLRTCDKDSIIVPRQLSGFELRHFKPDFY